jgi:hypothetical protein
MRSASVLLIDTLFENVTLEQSRSAKNDAGRLPTLALALHFNA